MKNILVPFDFSTPSANALQCALKIAGQSGGTVHVFHVIELPHIPNTVLSPARLLEEPLVREIGKKIQTRIGKLVTQHRAQGVRVITHLEFGMPVKKIQQFTEKHKVDIVILGSHGVHGIREYFLGSNAEKLVRTSAVPVLVVKEPHKGAIKSIVFPNSLDTLHQEDLIAKVKALQKFFNAHLHIVYVNTPSNFTSDYLTIERLKAFVKKFTFKNFTTSIYNHQYEDQGIIQFAEVIGADLIAMGTSGRKGLSHVLHGSMAEDVANHSKALIWTSVVKVKSKK